MTALKGPWVVFEGPEGALTELLSMLDSAGQHPRPISAAVLSPETLPDIVATTLLVSSLNKFVDVAVDRVRAKWRDQVRIRLVPIQVKAQCQTAGCVFAVDEAAVYVESEWADKGLLPKCPNGHDLVEVERGILPELLEHDEE